MNILRNSLVNYGKRITMLCYSKNLHTSRVCHKKKLTEEELEEMTLPDDIEMETGEAKKINLLEEMGITDPFLEAALIRGPGTKDNPNIVPTFEPKRLVGCVCEEDATCIRYMWVHIGDPKRCSCGYWFKAVQAPDPFEPFKGKEIY